MLPFNKLNECVFIIGFLLIFVMENDMESVSAAAEDFIRTANWSDMSGILEALIERISVDFNKHGVVPECVVESFKKVPVNTPLGSASVVIIAPDGRHILVVPKGKRHQLTGGKIEQGETIIAAAIREVGEEAGVVLHPEQLEKVNQRVYQKKGQTAVHHFFRCRLNVLPVLGKRKNQAFWLPLEQALMSRNFPPKTGYADAVWKSLTVPV